MSLELITPWIPFFFLLAIVYGGLEIGGVFKNRGVKIIISIAISAIGFASPDVVGLINQFIPYAAIFFIAVFFLGFIGKALKGKKPSKDWPLVIVVVGLVLIFLARMGEGFRDFFDQLPITYDNFVIIIAVVAFIALVYAAFRYSPTAR